MPLTILNPLPGGLGALKHSAAELQSAIAGHREERDISPRNGSLARFTRWESAPATPR